MVLEEDEPFEGQTVCLKPEGPVLLHMIFDEADYDCAVFEFCTAIEKRKLLFDRVLSFFLQLEEASDRADMLGVEEGKIFVLDNQHA